VTEDTPGGGAVYIKYLCRLGVLTRRFAKMRSLETKPFERDVNPNHMLWHQ